MSDGIKLKNICVELSNFSQLALECSLPSFITIFDKENPSEKIDLEIAGSSIFRWVEEEEKK